MSNSSLFYNVECVILALLKEQATALFGLPLLHEDEAKKAPAECIVVEGKQGEQSQEGFQPFIGTAEIKYRTDVHVPARSDAIYKAIRVALNPPKYHSVQGLDAFSWLNLMTEQITDDRNSTKNLRRWSVTLPVQAKSS